MCVKPNNYENIDNFYNAFEGKYYLSYYESEHCSRTIISSYDLSDLKKAFKENWQTYSENSNDSIEDNEIVNIALEHCKTNYDFIDTTYDSVNDEWTVEFWETGAKLPAQRVVLDKNGNVLNVWFAE